MSELGGVPPIYAIGFTAEVSLDGPIALTLRGNADGATEDALGSLIHRLHQVVIELGARTVLVDMSQLEFMNAASLNMFVEWLALIGDLSDDGRYVLRFRANAKMPWQERSLRTLSCFASNLVEREA